MRRWPSPCQPLQQTPSLSRIAQKPAGLRGFVTLQANALTEGIEQLDDVCQWVLVNYQQDERLPGAASFNLLMLAGTVVGGWLMSKAALIAKQKQAEDQDFYKAKQLTAQFYAEQVMPRAISYARAAKVGTETLMAMNDEMF